MHYDVEAEARLAWRSYAYFEEWDRRVGGECGFTPVGFLQLVPHNEVAALRANTAMQQAHLKRVLDGSRPSEDVR